jgi:hypothetical protein
MKWLLSFTVLFTLQLRADVSPDNVDTMIDQMVIKNVISRVEAEKAKIRMRSMSKEQWAQINTEAAKHAARSPASAKTESSNNIEEVHGIDLNSSQFQMIQKDLGKILPQSND